MPDNGGVMAGRATAASVSLTSTRTIRNLMFSMRPQTRTHGVVAAALLGIAIIAVLGHVCVLPVHAHIVSAEDHGSHGDTNTPHHAMR